MFFGLENLQEISGLVFLKIPFHFKHGEKLKVHNIRQRKLHIAKTDIFGLFLICKC